MTTLLLSLSISLTAVERTAESAVTPDLPNRRHEQLMDQIARAKGDFNLVLIGDSITDWWPKKGPDTYELLAPWKPLNLGIAAERTEHVLWRLNRGELDGLPNVKAVMVMIGTNNLGQIAEEKPEWVAAGVARILETVRAKLPTAKILLLGIFPRAAKANDGIRARITATNALLAKLGDGRTVLYKDVGPTFLAADGSLPADTFPDALHPNEKGYRLWLEAIKPTLDGLMAGQ